MNELKILCIHQLKNIRFKWVVGILAKHTKKFQNFVSWVLQSGIFFV